MAEARRMRPLLGTFVEVGARAASKHDAEAALCAAFAAVEVVQQRLSFHAGDSDLTRLNRGAGKAVPMHPLSLRVLRLARVMMVASDALFDVTVGGTLVRRGLLPDHGGPSMLERGEASDIELGDAWARLRRPVRVTLDGIAKGYAVDLAVRALRREGISAGWVNAGGDLRAFGDLVVPVRRREADRRLVALGGLRDAAIASSHAQEPSRDPDPDFAALIVGKANVTPSPGVFSVLARRAWRADALTKVACLAAPAKREPLVRRLGGLLVKPCVIVP